MYDWPEVLCNFWIFGKLGFGFWILFEFYSLLKFTVNVKWTAFVQQRFILTAENNTGPIFLWARLNIVDQLPIDHSSKCEILFICFIWNTE